MPQNSTNDQSSGQSSSSDISLAEHVASEPSVIDSSTDEESSGQPSDIPPAELSHVAPKSTVFTLVGMQANHVVQFLGLTATIVFGIWGIKVYIVSQKALQQNTIANELTLLNLCVSGGASMSIVSEACSGVPLGPALAHIASELSPNTQRVTDTLSITTRPEPTTPRSPPPPSDSPNMEEELSGVRPPTIATGSPEEPSVPPPCAILLPTEEVAIVSSSLSAEFPDLLQPTITVTATTTLLITPAPTITATVWQDTETFHFPTPITPDSGSNSTSFIPITLGSEPPFKLSLSDIICALILGIYYAVSFWQCRRKTGSVSGRNNGFSKAVSRTDGSRAADKR